jgi:hypothetical protein
MSAGSLGGLPAESCAPKAGADVYDFLSKQTESSRLRRVKELEQQNALLRRKVSEIEIEIAQLLAAMQRQSCR